MAVGWRKHIVPGKLAHERNKARPSYPTRPLLRRRADPALALRAWAAVGGTGRAVASGERDRDERAGKSRVSLGVALHGQQRPAAIGSLEAFEHVVHAVRRSKGRRTCLCLASFEQRM